MGNLVEVPGEKSPHVCSDYTNVVFVQSLRHRLTRKVQACEITFHQLSQTLLHFYKIYNYLFKLIMFTKPLI